MKKKNCKRTILDYLEQVILFVYKQDLDVLTNKVSERCVCARLAYYLEKILERTFWDNYYVDVEYDRMEKASLKQIHGDKQHICVLLIYNRGNNKPYKK
jgi:hypothetical protein